ncbi:MAG: hypothetical protein WD278_13605 [Pirellulales bacterium]
MTRFSLVSLLLAVPLVALGCAALVYATPVWARIVVTATLAALLAAGVGAFYLPDKSRVFAGGFAICGWGYLLLSQQPWLENMKGDLLTTAALNRLEPMLPKQAVADSPDARYFLGSRVVAPARQTDMLPGVSYARYVELSRGRGRNISAMGLVSQSSFHEIGHSLWAILLGCIGGGLATVFDGRRKRKALAN